MHHRPLVRVHFCCISSVIFAFFTISQSMIYDRCPDNAQPSTGRQGWHGRKSAFYMHIRPRIKVSKCIGCTFGFVQLRIFRKRMFFMAWTLYCSSSSLYYYDLCINWKLLKFIIWMLCTWFFCYLNFFEIIFAPLAEIIRQTRSFEWHYMDAFFFTILCIQGWDFFTTCHKIAYVKKNLKYTYEYMTNSKSMF